MRSLPQPRDLPKEFQKVATSAIVSKTTYYSTVLRERLVGQYRRKLTEGMYNKPNILRRAITHMPRLSNISDALAFNESFPISVQR